MGNNIEKTIREMVTPSWIRGQIERFKLQQKNVAKHLLTTEATLSRWLSGKQNLSGANKAALYWFFSYLQYKKNDNGISDVSFLVDDAKERKEVKEEVIEDLKNKSKIFFQN